MPTACRADSASGCGVVAIVTALRVYAVTGSDAERYFTAALSLSIATLAISYIAVFAALHRLRITPPDVPRPYRIPGGHLSAIVAGGSALLWTVLALGLLVWPPTLPETFAEDRLGFELASMLPLLLLGAGAALFAGRGRQARAPRPARPGGRTESMTGATWPDSSSAAR